MAAAFPPTSSSNPLNPTSTNEISLQLDRTHLSIKEIGDANRRAQLDGVAAGTCAGFLSGFLSTKGLKMSRNTGLLSGLLSGVVVGYIFTQESLKIQLKKAQDSNEALKKHLEQDDKRGGFVPDERGMEGMSLRERREVWDMTRGERGSGGMEGFEDKYQSTRGDH